MRIGVPKEIKIARISRRPDARRGPRICRARPRGARRDRRRRRHRRRRRRLSRGRRRRSRTPPLRCSRRADMIVKVKEPQPDEWRSLREGQILFTYLHLAPDPEQSQGPAGLRLHRGRLRDGDRRARRPAAAGADERGGRAAVDQAAATALKRSNGGRGVLLGGVPGVRRQGSW